MLASGLGAVAHLALLLLLLLDAPPGTGSDPAENPPQQVNGILGGCVQFPLKLPPTTVARIEWSFRTGSGPEFLIATFRDGKVEWRKTSARLGQQLEMADEATLRIRALEKEEDSGVLTASVLFGNNEVHEQTFRLSVFEPLPDPQIHAQLASRTAEECNMTLQCLASEKGGFDISWKSGNQLSVPEEGSDRSRLSAEGTKLHLSWRRSSPVNSSDSTVTCLLSNPVEQKNVSLDLLSICPSEGHPWTMWLLLALLLLLILVAGLGFCLWKERWPQIVVSLTTLKKNGSPKYLYMKLWKRRSPPEGDENQTPETSVPFGLQESCSRRPSPRLPR